MAILEIETTQAGIGTCTICRGSGLALFVQDLETLQLYGPFPNAALADRAKSDLCGELNYGPFRLHVAMGACTCGGRRAQKANASSQVCRLRTALPEPGFSQFDGMSWETFKAINDPEKEKAYRTMRHFARSDELNGKAGLVLAGDCGVGKTGLMRLAYQDRKSDGAIWVDYNEMIALIQATYGKPGSDTKAIIGALGNCPTLFIDDLGDAARTAPVSDDRRDKTYDVLRVRHQKKLPTFISTNLSKDLLKIQFGNRIASRIRELCLWIVVGGKDLRS